MKKYILLLASLILTGSFAQAQIFDKNTLVIQGGAGLEIFNTTYSYETKNTSLPVKSSNTDRAANSNFNIGAEYGLHKLFGIGLNFKRNSFFTSEDTATKSTPTAKSFDIAASANFHAVNVKKFDLVIGGEFGYSNLNYRTNDQSNLILKGNGTYAGIYLNPRIYFGKFGINFKFYAPFINYAKMTTNNEDLNNYVISKWKGTPGFGMSFGLQYAIGL
jgi:hypothetical protein